MISNYFIAFMVSLPFIFLFGIFIHWIFSGHRWKYRNPYDRTCKICGRNEVSHCWDLKSWNTSWWEVFDEGNPELHRSARPDKGDV